MLDLSRGRKVPVDLDASPAADVSVSPVLLRGTLARARARAGAALLARLRHHLPNRGLRGPHVWQRRILPHRRRADHALLELAAPVLDHCNVRRREFNCAFERVHLWLPARQGERVDTGGAERGRE